MSAKLDKWIVPLFYVLTLLGLPAEARVLLVWRDNPNLSAPPYDGGWETAATNIQDALDVALDGDTVLVTNGVYDAGGRVAPGDTTLKTRVIVTNAVTVRSVNGPEATLIVGQPHTTGGLGDTAVRGVYLNNGGVLSGFTVTNGFTRSGTSTTASYVGGGVRCEGVAAAVSNCVIVANQAAMRGGGVFQGTLTDCRVITNIVVSSSTSAGGGGVYGAAVSVSLIENNRTLGSSTDGGGTHSCTLDRCTLRGNASARHGGGAYLSTLVSCTVESNSAVQQGGGAHSPVVVTNSLIRWNTAGYYGGGRYKGAVTDSVIASNTVTGLSYDGGGYYGNSAADDRLTGCDVVGNVARNGGGVYNAVLSNCTVRANRAVGSSATTGSGGGYYASATGYQVYNTRFLDNEANYRGGGAYQGKFFGCVFSGNRAAQGGGFYSGSTSYVLYNCSVMGNCATNQYGGTYSGTVSNSIVYANTAVTGPNYGGGTFRHSCADPLPAGAGNTNVNPLVSGWRDPHLLPGSPLIAAGAFGPWMDGAADLDGDARASDGVVDIGADQFSGSTLDGPLAVALVSDTNVCAVAWPHLFRAEAEGKVSGIYWDFGDGFTAQGLNPATHAFAVPGVYAVKVTVSNETHAAFATFEITVIDYVVYASPEGGHVPPFVSWADAATNLQDAVDAVALPGGRVLAGDGVYDAGARVAAGQTVTNRLVLDKAVRVESVNGPAATVIAGRWHSEETPLGALAVRGVYVANGAVLCGFTVSNGATAAASYSDNGRGGGLFLAAGGAATNCTVTGCRAWVGGGAAGAAGVLRGC
ncbi:MAG: PKD domain-containing protein, partial [Kiritimatiellia bacterium]